MLAFELVEQKPEGFVQREVRIMYALIARFRVVEFKIKIEDPMATT